MSPKKTSSEQRRMNIMQILFALLCLIVIASMVFAAFAKF